MAVEDLTDTRLLEFSRRLQFVHSFDGLIDELSREVRENLGYATSWVLVFVPELQSCKVFGIQGSGAKTSWRAAPMVSIAGDVFLTELIETGGTVVVDDALNDPRSNREIVERMRNRTVIMVPMMLAGEPFGALYAGTFADEGVRLPTDDQLAYMRHIAHYAAVASERLTRTAELEESAQDHAASLGARIEEELAVIRAGAVKLDVGHKVAAARIDAAAARAEVLAGELAKSPGRA